jgi:hypothetical protein
MHQIIDDSTAQVLIDHSTSNGFESIAEAREVLLKMGRKELTDPATKDEPVRGSHVIAPVSVFHCDGFETFMSPDLKSAVLVSSRQRMSALQSWHK